VKFLLDVCVSSRALTRYLLDQAHDVVLALNIDPKASDERLLAYAHQEGRVLLTEDKDLGELVFVMNLPHGPIVRLVELSVDEQVNAIGEFLDHRSQELSGQVMVTIARGHVRVRRRGG
jgi:predicted nuclease of predicted toxin-antitoxin system